MVPGLVLAALVLTAGVAHRIGRLGAVGLALVSVVWLLLDSSMEGAVLWSVTSRHGLTGGDLAGLAGLALAAWLWFADPGV